MIRRSLLTILMAAALAACAPAAAATTPPINPTDIGATALALANAMLTQTPDFAGNSQPPEYMGATQAAPGTPVPVTGLSGTLTTETPGAVTGLPGILTTETPGAVDCNHPLDVAAAGRGVRLAIKNLSQGAVSVLLGIASPNSLGHCGWISVSIPKKSKTVLLVPESHPELGDWCYWASASISAHNTESIVAGKDFCVVSGSHWIMNVSDAGISLTGP